MESLMAQDPWPRQPSVPDPALPYENPHTYMGAEAKTHSKLTKNWKSTGQRRKLTQNSLKTGNPQSAKNRKYKNIKIK